MDETTIRRIIREEIARAFEITALAAETADHSESGELRSSALSAMSDVARAVKESVTGTWHSGWCMAAYGGACTRDCEINWETS